MKPNTYAYAAVSPVNGKFEALILPQVNGHGKADSLQGNPAFVTSFGSLLREIALPLKTCG